MNERDGENFSLSFCSQIFFSLGHYMRDINSIMENPSNYNVYKTKAF